MIGDKEHLIKIRRIALEMKQAGKTSEWIEEYFRRNMFDPWVQYVNNVITMVYMSEIWNVTLDLEERSEKFREIDEKRHNAHNLVMKTFGSLNLVSKKYGLPKFTNVDIDDRQAVADLVGEIVIEAYCLGTQRSLNDMVKQFKNFDDLVNQQAQKRETLDKEKIVSNAIGEVLRE